MIKLQDLTPDVYYKNSRDFQFIGRLYDLVLNYSKTNCDLIYNLPLNDNTDEQLMDLLALTLGFTPKYKYTSKQLRAICSVLPYALKNKGNITAFLAASTALINAEELDQEISYSISDDKTTITLYVPQNISDVTILNDLLDYLLPAGMTCKIIKELREKKPTLTKVGTSDILTIYQNGTYDPDRPYLYDSNRFAELSHIYIPEESGYSPEESGVWMDGQVADNIGIIANGQIYKPEDNN